MGCRRWVLFSPAKRIIRIGKCIKCRLWVLFHAYCFSCYRAATNIAMHSMLPLCAVSAGKNQFGTAVGCVRCIK